MKHFKKLIFGLGFFFTLIVFAQNQFTVTNKPEQKRRAKPAAFDSIFPITEYFGPTIGVPSNSTYPFTKMLWKNFPNLKEQRIEIYGWINPSFNWSTSKNSNLPLGYAIVPTQVELNELVLIIERSPDTVQTDYVDWGFHIINLFGMDYRFTIAQGIFSNQLLKNNNLYGYDPIEVYGQLYFPKVARGMVVTFGRFMTPSDISSQLAPQNFLFTHSVMSTFDTDTQTGINAAIKLNNTWTILFGILAGNDVAPWDKAASIPTFQAFVRWVSDKNNDSLWGGIASLNNGRFKNNHDNLQQFSLVWSHRFTPQFFTLTEIYYLYQYNAARGGTCNFGPIRSFGGGGGCGPIIPGLSSALGAVNFIVFKVSKYDFMSFRTDLLSDFQGQRTSYATTYMSWTLGLTHVFGDIFEMRPEIRYDTAFDDTPYDNGRRKNQFIFAIDAILRF